MAKPTQREFMRKLVQKFGLNQKAVCTAYAQAERDGIVDRKFNSHGKSPEWYALALWKDGISKGWL